MDPYPPEQLLADYPGPMQDIAQSLRAIIGRIPMPFGDGTQRAKNVIAAGGGTLRWNGAAAQAEAAFSRWQPAGVRAFGMATFMRVRRVAQRSGDAASRPASRTNR